MFCFVFIVGLSHRTTSSLLFVYPITNDFSLGPASSWVLRTQTFLLLLPPKVWLCSLLRDASLHPCDRLGHLLWVEELGASGHLSSFLSGGPRRAGDGLNQDRKQTGTGDVIFEKH